MAAPVSGLPGAADRQRGFALVTVLWAAMILAGILASVTATGRTEARLANTHYAAAQLEAVADAAINLTILGMLDVAPGARPSVDGTPFTVAFAGHAVGVSVQDETGKINLNMAEGELLRQLLIAVGVAVEDAQPLIDKILDWREGGIGKRLNGAKAEDYRNAGFAYGPRNGPFASVEELQLVMGVTPALFERIAPSLTVYSQTPWVDPGFAANDVLAALSRMGGAPVSAILAARETGPTGGVMLGHAFTIVAEASGGVRLRVARSAVLRLNDSPRKPLEVYRWR